MKRLLAVLFVGILASAVVNLSRSDEPKSDKKEEAKGPSIKLVVPDKQDVFIKTAVDAVVKRATELKVDLERDGYQGPVKVKLTVTDSPPEGKSKKTVFTKEETFKAADPAKKEAESITFELPAFSEGDTYIAALEASAGELKDAKEVTLTVRKPDPTGDGYGDKGLIGDPPSPGKTTQLDPNKSDPKATAENQDTQQKAIVDGYAYMNKIADAVGKNWVAINMMWTLITGYLVMFMQAGFALVETGLTRAKNVTHTMAMNIMIYGIGMMVFWAWGFGLMFGGNGAFSTLGTPDLLKSEYTIKLFDKDFGIFGYDGFALSGRGFDSAVMTIFLFQMVFMDTAATIPTGAMAERWKFLSFCIYGIFIAGLIYPIYGNWVWCSTGWLNQLGANFGYGHGHVDFAGSSVVHMTGGITALAGAWLLGPRLGKYNKDGTVNVLPAHNVPMYVLGTLILAFGWFGFNPGSTLAGRDLNIGRIAANTMLASGAGSVVSMIYMWIVYKKPDPSFMCNGMLAGLVAITAPCAFVAPWAAVAIGAISGIIVIWAALFVERILKVDDPVGAVAVHGFNGCWGVLALGLFADGTYGKGWNNTFWYKVPDGSIQWTPVKPTALPEGWIEQGVTGLFYGNPTQFYAEAIGVGANIVWVFLAAVIVFWLLNKIVGNRVSAAVEIQGLDIPELGVAGYINEDPKTPEGHVLHASLEPRAAVAPPNGARRFSVLVQGADQDAISQAWSGLCQPSQAPPKGFLLIYPHMTTLQGTRFRFRSGDPEEIRLELERLLQGQMRGKPVRAVLDG